MKSAFSYDIISYIKKLISFNGGVFVNSMNLILCAVAAAALDLCTLILIITAYREKRSAAKNWNWLSNSMELAEQGMTYDLGCDEILIGRHASADIRLPDLSVSRYHAMLTVSNGSRHSIAYSLRPPYSQCSEI